MNTSTASLTDALSFGFTRKLPVILQTEEAECGLACLAMIAWFHGCRAGMPALRRDFPASQKGSTVDDLMRTASRMHLAARPLKLELEHLGQLRLPCILHWNFNHFVVLKEAGDKFVTIHDPALGLRRLSLQEVSKSFTGVALELWPAPDFQPKKSPPRVPLTALMGQITGLYRSLGQIVLLALALEAFALASPFFMQLVIDEVLVGGDRHLLATLALGFLTVMLLHQAVSAARAWAILYLSATLSLQWAANVFAHLVRLPLQYFQRRHLGDVVSRFESIRHIQQTLGTAFVESVLDGLMTVATLVMMFLYSPALAWVAVAATLLYAGVRIAFYRPVYLSTEEEISHDARQDSLFLETLRGVRTVKLFERHEERRASWLAVAVERANAHVRTERLKLLFRLVNGVLFGLENILIVWLGALLVLDNSLSAGVLIAFIAYKAQFGTRVTSLIDHCLDLRMLRLHGERLADIVLTAPEQVDGRQDHALSAGSCLEVRGVDFRYGENEPWVLHGVDMRIEAGESVAIVGPSGGGKSTLMHIMLGMLAPVQGEVLVDGRSLSEVGTAALRRAAGTVMQDDALFAGSVADNICFFDAQPDRARIEECARAAAVHDDIDAMPMGYNTLIGDMGTVLSGGQKQRILLARALYKRPAILFLDEATSHLDLARERQVNAAVKAMRVMRIIIAHRPQSIAMADRVFVLEDGMLRELSPEEREADGVAQADFDAAQPEDDETDAA